MILYLIAPGQTDPDTGALTCTGRQQAQKLKDRLSVYGIDRIFTSPEIAARQTAKVCCDAFSLTAETENWMDARTVSAFSAYRQLPRAALYQEDNCLHRSNWYRAPLFGGDSAVREAFDGIAAASDAFLLSLGFERTAGVYRSTGVCPDRAAVFCRPELSTLWLAHLLSLAPQILWRILPSVPDTGYHVVHFEPDASGFCPPRCLQMGVTPHLYEREGAICSCI